MSVHSKPTKFIGTAGEALAYYDEKVELSADMAAGYYGVEKGEVVFEHLGGKAAKELVGLELSLGLTRSQHADIHNGRWNGVQLVQAAKYAPVWERNDKGHPVMELNVKTGKLEKKPVMIPVMIPDGSRKMDPVTGKRVMIEKIDPLTGKPEMMQKTESRSVAGYDVRYAFDKSVAEYLIAHPEDTQLIKNFALQAVDTANRIAIEEYCEVIDVRRNGVKTMHKAEGLIWASAVGMSARPTPESESRVLSTGEKVGPDPHFHVHSFVFAAAYVGEGKWRKIDGRKLFETSLFRADVASNTFNRLCQQAGIDINYHEANHHNGRIVTEFGGSSLEARQLFSSNSRREARLLRAFEDKYNREWTPQEKNEIMSATKLAKTKAAKLADRVGNLEQAERWDRALTEEGITARIPGRNHLITQELGTFQERAAELFRRLDQPNGIAACIKQDPVFGPEEVLPAVYKAGEGLNLTDRELDDLADQYRDTHLIPLRNTVDKSAELYTTQLILDSEGGIGEEFERRAAQTGPSAKPIDIARALRSQRFSPTPEQVAIVEAVCSDAALVHIGGKAGTAKTTTMLPANQCLRRSGAVDQIILVTFSRKTGEEGAEAMGADKGWTVEALESNYEKGWRPDAKTMVVIDEVGLLNTFQLNKVLQMTKGAGKTVSVADLKQATSIGAGGSFAKELEKRPPKMLTQVFRHKDWRDRQAFDMLREGDAHGALENLHARGRVFAVDKTVELVRLAQERYEHYREAGYEDREITVVNTGSNRTLDAVSRAIQRSRIQAEEISEFAHFDVSEVSTGRTWRIHSGDRVIFKKGHWVDVGSDPIANGTYAEVLRMDPDGSCRLQLEKGDRRTLTIQLKPEALEQVIVPAYCLATAKFQGGSVKVGLNIPGDTATARLNSGYSQMTRITDVGEVLLSRELFGEHPIVGLGEAWSKEEHKREASELLEMDLEVEEELELSQELSLSENLERLQEVKQTLEGGGISI